MSRVTIGELEELVLLTVGILPDNAYGVTVMQQLEEQTGRQVNISAIHAVLSRLEEKGLLKSYMGGATSERGGRRKRFFQLSLSGREAVEDARFVREKLYSQLPPLSATSST